LAPLTKSLRTVLSAVKAKQATDISRLCLGEQFEHAKTQTDRRTETGRDRQQRHVKYDKISRHYASYASTAEHRYIGRNDVTESMVTIRSPFVGITWYNVIRYDTR